jgi:phosphatidylglycerophosphate synthase
VAAIADGALFWSTSSWPAGARVAFVLAALLLQLRLVANLLDGMVAIASGKASRVGELYNEVPDRISDAAALIGAGYAAGGDPVLGFLAASTALFVAYVRAMGKAAGAPSEFCGPMAKQQRMFVLTVTALWLGLTPGGWQPVFTVAGSSGGLMALALLSIIVLGIATAARRLARIGRALRTGGTPG